jgi:hypothetical protein
MEQEWSGRTALELKFPEREGRCSESRFAGASTFDEVLFILHVKQWHLLNQSTGAMELQFRLSGIISLGLAPVRCLQGLPLYDERARSCRLRTKEHPDNAAATK